MRRRRIAVICITCVTCVLLRHLRHLRHRCLLRVAHTHRNCLDYRITLALLVAGTMPTLAKAPRYRSACSLSA